MFSTSISAFFDRYVYIFTKYLSKRTICCIILQVYKRILILCEKIGQISAKPSAKLENRKEVLLVKRIISVTLAILMILASVSCGSSTTEDSSAISSTSSAKQILIERLGGVPDTVVLGDETVAAEYGIDMSDFDDDGYIVRTVNGKTLIFGKTEDAIDRGGRYYSSRAKLGQVVSDKVYGEGAKVKSFTIGGKDISEFVITVTKAHPEKSYPESTEYAATELAQVIYDATRVNVPVVDEDLLAADASYIRLTCDGSGDNGDEGFTVTVTADGNVEIMGGLKRGCLYAVYDIAEQWLGERFVAYDYTYIYEADAVNITESDSYSDAPKMNMRYPATYTINQPKSSTVWGFSELPEFAAKQKINGNTNEAKYGYAVQMMTNHGMYHYWGCDPSATNLCYTDDVLNDQVIERIGDVLEKAASTGALYEGDSYTIQLGQNDNNNFCMCKACMNVIREEGAMSGVVVRQANMISDYFAEDYPQAHFTIYGYWGTEKPCKTKVNDNISVEYCITGPCYGGPIDGSECIDGRVSIFSKLTAQEEIEYLRGWVAIAKNVDVRLYYFTRSFDKPNNVMNHLYEDMQYMYNIGIRNLYVEIEYGVLNLDFAYPAAYLMARLMWDPTMSREEYNALRDEIFYLTYGEGYEYIIDYVELYNTFFVCCDIGWGAVLDYYEIEANIDYAFSLFDAAEAAAESARAANRVRMLKTHLVFNAIYMWYEDKTLNGTDEDKAYMTELYAELKALFEEADIQYLTVWKEVNVDEIDWDGNPAEWTRGKLTVSDDT